MNILKCQLPVTNDLNKKSSVSGRTAFTLIELLVVISIIGVLAAFTIPGLKAVKRKQMINTATAELKQLESAIENYHAKYGVYPPSNTNNVAFNQLYYELSGVNRTNIGGVEFYRTLDSSATIKETDYILNFHVGGVVNCAHGSGEDASKAAGLLASLPPNRVDGYVEPAGVTNILLVTSVRGPDATYRPLGAEDVNPFRYNSSNPTNNPNTYDLWIDLSISGKTNRISNWNRQPQVL